MENPQVLIQKEKTARTRTIARNVTIITALITATVSFYEGWVNVRKDKHLHMRETLKIELEFVSKHTKQAIKEDVNERLRFSEYIKFVYPTAEQRNRWNQYYLLVKNEADQTPPISDTIKSETKIAE